MTRCRIFLPLLAVFCFLAVGDAATIPRRPRTTSTPTCGYESCAAVDPKKLNIHLVAHTHDDVGWLKTVDQYYFGSKSTIQKAGVQYILDSVVQSLLVNPSRKFIYVETAFFWKWWQKQGEQTKEYVRALIDEGRLEIIGGGWSMNDEATTHYHSIVDQFTWGFRRLNDTFGRCARPRIGWQIDPFGHSREQASLFAQMGFDGMLFGRIDYQDKAQRLRDKSMEFVWKSSPNLGKRADLFTTAMFNTYSPPPGFCFDVLCADQPIIDDPSSPEYNVPERIDAFLRYSATQAKYYRTNNIILTMGGDFTYQHAEMYFMNLDKLIRYMREMKGDEVNIFYSTPSCYLKAVHDQNLSWPTKTDDFFPYASDPHAFWTGYFTSRPTVKFFERMGNNLLQISKQVSALTDLQNYKSQLERFREAMGIMQHHDAVTGTEKQLVADDYARILYDSMHNGEIMLADAIGKWGVKVAPGEEKNVEAIQPNLKMFSCMQLNITSCPYSENNKNFLVTIYNPLARPVTTHVRVPIQGNGYTVKGFKDEVEVASQITPVPEAVLKIPGRQSSATNELVFTATLPALGYKIYVVTEKAGMPAPVPSTATNLQNNRFTVSVNDQGEIEVNYNEKTQQNMNFVQSFHYYEGAEGDNKVYENRSSGAYIFRPINAKPNAFAYNGRYQIFNGPVVQEIHHSVNEWVSQVVRIYTGDENIEFEWLVGPIPVGDKIGKEIITKYSSNLNTKGVFYTDANGREMLKRKRNFRPTWDVELEEPVAGNYYPVTSKIYLRDSEQNMKLSVLVDRAEGGSSMKDGEIELMVHRRLLRDDAFGVGEALNESAFGEGLVVRGVHHVLGGYVTNLDEFALKEKNLALQLSLRPWTLISPLANDRALEDWDIIAEPEKSGLTKALPPNVHILTLEPWKDDSLLLRLEHIIEYDEAIQLSQPAEVNIKDLFSTFDILSVEETTLGGNQWLKDSNPLKWQPESNDIFKEYSAEREPVKNDGEAINVLLEPMEIRTFIIKVSPRRF